MAGAAESSLSLKEGLVRYLKTGTQGTFFLPGKNKLFRMFGNVMTLMIETGQGIEAVETIKRINNEKSYFKREPLLYFLAVATHQCSNLEVKRAAYAIVGDVCENPVDLFMYLKHVKVLSQFTKGWGKGLRRVVCDWYNSKDAMEVAAMVTQYRNVERWSHKDVFRLAHIKPANEGIGFVVSVTCKGLEATKKSYQDPSATIEKLIKYFEAVDFVKHSTDGTAISIMMEEHDLHIQHIPSTVMSSKEVWSSLLQNTSLTQTLTYLNTLTRRGFLTVGDKSCRVTKEIQNKVLLKVKDTEAIEKEKISPFFIYIVIRNYTREFTEKKKWGGNLKESSAHQKSGASQDGEVTDQTKKKKKKKKKKRGHCEDGEPVENNVEPNTTDLVTKNNPELYEALHVAFRVAVEKNLPSTGKRYLLAVKASIEELGKGIRGSPSITALEVMALMATFYKKTEKSSELGFFTASFSPMKYHSEVEDLIQEIGNRAAPVPDLACDPAMPVTWALEKQKKYDVFLVLSDGHESQGEVTPADKLEEYRQKMNLPNSKLVICSLTAARMDFACATGMLDIGGFDVTVPSIIHQFVTDQLDQ